MKNNRDKILEVIANLIDARDVVFTQIVNLAMSNELSHLDDAFDVGDAYSFKLRHFENVEDVNVKKLVELCENVEETIFNLMDLNGIKSNEINF